MCDFGKKRDLCDREYYNESDHVAQDMIIIRDQGLISHHLERHANGRTESQVQLAEHIYRFINFW